jgi:hypothetical protein
VIRGPRVNTNPGRAPRRAIIRALNKMEPALTRTLVDPASEPGAVYRNKRISRTQVASANRWQCRKEMLRPWRFERAGSALDAALSLPCDSAWRKRETVWS